MAIKRLKKLNVDINVDNLSEDELKILVVKIAEKLNVAIQIEE